MSGLLNDDIATLALSDTFTWIAGSCLEYNGELAKSRFKLPSHYRCEPADQQRLVGGVVGEGGVDDDALWLGESHEHLAAVRCARDTFDEAPGLETIDPNGHRPDEILIGPRRWPAQS